MSTNKRIQGEKYLWQLPEVDQQLVLDFASAYNLPFGIIQTLLSRGYTSKDAIDSFLHCSLEKDVKHPALLKDAQKAVDRIIQAINNGEKILVAGDYDVDGITSSSLMMLCLKSLGAHINFFLPHRVNDGYGLSTKVVDRAAQNGYKVIVTVDNGITAFKPAEEAKKAGIDLIITDHHRPHDVLPDAYAIVNPHQIDCTYPYKTFAGVGVIFKLLSLLYEKLGVQMPAKAYELLLLGTVADVVPLTGENRYWVRYGLQYINSMESHALKVLKYNSKVTKTKLSSSDIGFSITPQINALGRLEDSRQGVKFLIGSDVNEIERVGRVLYELNQARKDIERTILDDVTRQIEMGNIDLSRENLIIAGSANWAPGVIGLVASRLVAAYGRPTVLFHITKDGIAKGSCRSIKEFNMFDALTASRDLLDSFGGHSLAAGLALRQENIAELKRRLEARIAESLTPYDLQQKLTLDAEVKLAELTKQFVHNLEYLEPFGYQNPQPVFYVKDVYLVQQPVLLKDNHVKFSVFADGIIKPVIFFNRPELFEKLLAQGQYPFDIAIQVLENHWAGNVTIELNGLDVARLRDEETT